MKRICTLGWWGILLLMMTLARADYPGLVMRPWFGAGGVLVPVSDSERLNNGGAVILEGAVEKPSAVRLEFSLWDDTKFSVNTDHATKANPVWSFRAKDMNYKVGKELPGGAGFSIRVFSEDSKKPWTTTLTNMVVGPVWVLCASPETDGFELPKLSVEALARVRVLVLEGTDWKGAKGTWRTAGAVEKAGDRLFCGMPRAFANAVCESLGSGTNKNLVIGLVIVPPEFIQPLGPYISQGRVSKSLSVFSTSELANANSWLMAGALAARSANTSATATGDGVLQRRIRALERYREAGYDLQREGKVGQPFQRIFHRWEYILTGADASQVVKLQGKEVVPFRVTGVIWGVDRSLKELKEEAF